MNDYRCVHCGVTQRRDSKKQWVKSYCGLADRVVHLMLLKKGAKND